MKSILFVLSLGALIIGCAQAQNQPGKKEAPKIELEITGVAQPGTAYLIGTYVDQRFRIDSTQMDANGRMVFQRDSAYPSGLIVVVLPGGAGIQILLDQDQTFSLKTNINDVANSTVVEGNLDNELLYQVMKFEESMRPQFDVVAANMKANPAGTPEYERNKREQERLMGERKAYLQKVFDDNPNAFYTKFKMAGQNPDLLDVRKSDGTIDTQAQVYHYRNHFWDNVDFADERLLRTPVIATKLKRYITELTPQLPDSINLYADKLIGRVLKTPNYIPEYFKYFANWVVLNYEPGKSTLMDPQGVFVHMAQNYFTYEKAFWSDSTEIYRIQQRASEMAASLVGKKAPDVQAKDPGGKLRSISEIKAPYIVVYMYNPTCEHCMVETPKMVQYYNQMKSQGVEVFGIALDTDDAEWKDYIAKTGMTWVSVFDPTNRAIYGKYYVDITPEIYVINPDRVIIAKNLKVEQIQEMIDRDKRKRG